MTSLANKQQAAARAIELAVANLAGVDLPARCRLLGLPAPEPDGRLVFRLLGRTVQTAPPDFPLLPADGAKPVSATDRILALHYLRHDLPLTPAGAWITFRELPGGQFYYTAFVARSLNPLVQRIGNHLDLLRQNLARFDWQPAPMGDFAARIHVLGRLEVTLVYHCGDEEIGPEAQLLFDASIKRIYCSEDVAVLAGRICLGLL